MRIHTALVVVALAVAVSTPSSVSLLAEGRQTTPTRANHDSAPQVQPSTDQIVTSATIAIDPAAATPSHDNPPGTTGRTPSDANRWLAAVPDDSNWQPMGAQLGAHPSSFAVFSLYESSFGVMAGGTFFNAGGAGGNYIARWNGTDWTPVGTGTNNSVVTMVDYGGSLVAGGWFATAGGNPASLIASWDGATWSPVGSGFVGVVTNALSVYGGNLIAGGEGFSGNNFISQWNGSSWATIGGGTNGIVNALQPFNGALIAGGTFTTAGGNSANHVAAWDGASWTALGSGTDGTVRALAMYNGKLVAGGDFTNAGGNAANHIAQWDGVNWSPIGAGVGPSMIGVGVWSLATYCNNLYAGGLFFIAGADTAWYVARWDGASWAPLGSGTNAEVRALAMLSDTLVVGGQFTTAGGKADKFIARWAAPRADADLDCIPDSIDNCPVVYNPGQEDSTFNGVGDVCDVGDPIIFAVYSPIDMVITDPAGDSIGVDSLSRVIFNTIGNGATYDTLTDQNSSNLTGPDGETDDIVTIPNPMVGAYSVRLLREPGASDSAHFTHSIRINGNQQLIPDGYRDATVSSLGTPEVPAVVTYTTATTLPGDVNADGKTTSSDIIYMVNYVFKGGAAPVVTNHGDVNCDGVNTSADIIYLVNYTFKGGATPCSQSGG